jgi:endonuclease YncB( thermonuclease family)
MKHLASIATFLLLLCFNSFAAEQVKVIDGDTIHIGKLKYRFSGIDAPEMKQLCNKDGKEVLCGVLAKNALIEKINNSPVTCKIEEVDRYKRLVAECFVREESLSKFLVKNGYAVAYRRYSMKFVEDENYAKENKLGLWSMTFEYPWDYRTKARAK